MRIEVISFGVDIVHDDCDSLEDLYSCIMLALSLSPRSGNSDDQAKTEPREAPTSWQGRFLWKDRVRPQPWDAAVEGDHVGGLRDAAKSIGKIPGMREEGLKIGRALGELYKREPEVKRATLAAVADKLDDNSLLQPHVDKVVDVIAGVVGCADRRWGIQMGLHCEIRPRLMSSWRQFVGDPDDQVEKWCEEGPPYGDLCQTGISQHLPLV